MNIIMGLLCIVAFASASTDIPVIGILTQESLDMEDYFPNEKYHSFIAASYVKFLESAGARVIPIWIGKNEGYYRKVVESTNGLLIPGGAADFYQNNGYAVAGLTLYNLAIELYENGDYYPIWGTCLGMELLADVAAGGKELRTFCSAENMPLPLEFRPNFNTSKMFKNASKEILTILENENVTFNNHKLCVIEETLTLFGLDKDWRIISTNKDENGTEFISAFESIRYPFYGIQFHPEKNQYEFMLSLKIPRSREAIESAQYFANFFVEETRKNNYAFGSWEAEQKSLIYNYPVHFTGIKNSSYHQVYMFKESDYLVFL